LPFATGFFVGEEVGFVEDAGEGEEFGDCGNFGVLSYVDGDVRLFLDG
jgi:hypothetical protein